MFDNFIPINRPIIDNEEVDAATSVIKSGILTSPSPEGGPAVQQLEKRVCEYTGARHAVAVNSGTAALQAALLSLNVGAGDEVIVPSFTYVATANAVKSVGATPVFADISLNNYTIKPDSIKNCITSRTAAIIPVHLYGLVADMDQISEVAENIPVIEDAAQSLGSTIHNRHTGTLANIGCYSLYPGKVATAGEGGIIVTNDDAIHDTLLAVRNHGNIKGEFATFGVNMRMPEVSAAIAHVQMKKLPAFLDARRRNAALLSDRLQNVTTGQYTIQLPTLQPGEDPNWNLYTVSLSNRDQLLGTLNQNNVGAAIYYKTPIHRTPHYTSKKTILPNTEKAAQMVLSIPVHPGVTAHDISNIVKTIQNN